MILKYDKTLITGKPGVGKTTFIRKVVERIDPSVKMAGFYTAEIRNKGARLGFELRGLNGAVKTLAHVDIAGRHRVGRYGVDTSAFEEFLRGLDLPNPGVELVVIDEIGKMELFSIRFRRLVQEVLISDQRLLATIALRGEAFIQEIKRRSGVHLLEMTLSNRDRLMEEIFT